MDLEDLPYLVTEILWSYLNQHDLLSLMCCSSALCSNVQESVSCWRFMCVSKWDVHERQEHTWFQCLRNLELSDLAPYGDLYAVMKRAIKILRPVCFDGGVSEASLDALERSIGVPIPRSVRLYYRLAGASEALHYGSYSFYDYELDLTIPQFEYHHTNQRLSRYGSLPGFPLCGLNPAGYYVAWDDSSVVAVDRFASQHRVASSLARLLQFRAQAQLSGHYAHEQLWPLHGAPTAVTQGIQVRVSVLYVPQLSDNRRAFFAYRVSVSAVAPEVPWCRLTTRHWQIEPEGQPVEHVSGPGVIGLYPEMYTGAPEFSYESCCPLAGAQRGVMRGTLEFQKKNGDVIHVVVPEFVFDATQPLTPV